MRARGLRPEGERHVEVADRRSRARRRAARRMRGVERIARQRLASTRGELDGVGLAEDQRARMATEMTNRFAVWNQVITAAAA